MTREDITWYTDGSSSDPRCPAISAFGFGIVVVADDGELVAFGYGTPPDFVDSPALAEAYALFTAIDACPTAPRVVTDSLSLITIAEQGVARATAGSATGARLWTLIAKAVDGDLPSLARDRRLT